MAKSRSTDDIAKLNPHELQNIVQQRDDLAEQMGTVTAERDAAVAKAAASKLALDDANNELAKVRADCAQILAAAGGMEAVQAIQREKRRASLLNTKKQVEDELAKLA